MAANKAAMYGRLNETFQAVKAAERKLTRTAEIQLLVDDLSKATNTILSKVTAFGGEVTNSASTTDSTAEPSNVLLQVRVPAARLDDFLKELRGAGWRVESESTETADVTAHHVDTEAKLRNLKAVEQQYLALLKRSRSVEDTLKITEKLNATRTEIDSTQGELHVLNQQVDTSLVKITLRRDAEARVFGIYWRPFANFKRSLHDLLSGLTDYVDAMVSFIVQLPLYALWRLTVLVFIAIGVRICLTIFRFFFSRGWFTPKRPMRE
jgi:hypothetical protein